MQYSEDGSRAFVITTTPGTATKPWGTTVAVVDAATGLTVAAPITVDGKFDSLYSSSQYLSGTAINRAALITTGFDGLGRPTTTVTTINTDDGTVVDPTPLVLNGQLARVQSLHEGRAAYLVTETIDSSGAPTSTTVTLVNFADGTRMSRTSAPTFPGRFDSLEIVGNDALLSYTDHGRTYLAVIEGDGNPADDQIGKQVGRSIELPANQAYPAIVSEYFSDNGFQSNAVILGKTADPTGRQTTTLTTIDVSTGLSTATLVLNGRTDDLNYLQYNQDRAYVIIKAASTPTSPATTSVVVIDRGTASAVTPTPVTGTFDSLVFDPDPLHNRALLITTETDTKGATITHVTIINTDTATPIGPPINLAGQPADTAIIWSDDNDPTPQATLITTATKPGTTTTITTLTTIDLAAGTTKT